MRNHVIIALIHDGHDAVGESIDSAMHARPRKETALGGDYVKIGIGD